VADSVLVNDFAVGGDKVGVILDVEVTTGQTNEGEMIEPQVDEVEAIKDIA
jgi:hypothetical protein